MAYVDIGLELQVLRMNVSGIVRDVRDVKGRGRALPCADADEQDRCDRLQEHIRRIEKRLAALELRVAAAAPWQRSSTSVARCSDLGWDGRGSRTRTGDPLLPKQMRYQTAPCPGRARDHMRECPPLKER